MRSCGVTSEIPCLDNKSRYNPCKLEKHTKLSNSACGRRYSHIGDKARSMAHGAPSRPPISSIKTRAHYSKSISVISAARLR